MIATILKDRTGESILDRSGNIIYTRGGLLDPDSLNNYQGEALFNQTFPSDNSPVPTPVSWNTESPVGLVDWSAVAFAMESIATGGSPLYPRSDLGSAVLISPRHALVSPLTPGTGADYRFLTPGGTEVSRQRVAYGEISSTLAWVRFSSPIVNITPMRIAASSRGLRGQYVLCITKERRLNVRRIKYDVANSLPATSHQATTLSPTQGGSVGLPALILVDNVPALAILPQTTVVTGPTCAYYIAAINAVLSPFSEALTAVDLDLSGTLIENSGSMSSRTRVRRKYRG